MHFPCIPSMDAGCSIIRINNGDYIIAGSRGITNAWLIRVTNNGDIVWSKTYNENLTHVFFDIVAMGDSSFVALGKAKNGYMACVKFNTDGDTIWSRFYGSNLFYLNGEEIIATSDKGCAVVGLVISYENDSKSYDGFLIKINENGELEWNKTYGGKGYDRFFSIAPTLNGGYIMVGVTSGSYDINGTWVVKVDLYGNLLWSKIFRGMIGWRITPSLGGGYLIIAEGYGNESSSGSNIKLIKIEEDGSVEWNKTYDLEGDDRVSSVIQLLDGSYIIAGSTKYLTNNSDVFLIKIDENGNLIWMRTYNGERSNRAYDIAQSLDGGYVIVGKTGGDILLMKVDENGDLIWVKTYNGAQDKYSSCDGRYHGVCDEYAVLFISFARAVNIPARQIYVHTDSADGHEFAEIWDGSKWVHADPTWNKYDDPGIYRENGLFIEYVKIYAGANDSKDSDDTYGDGIIYWYEYNEKIDYNPNPYQW